MANKMTQRDYFNEIIALAEANDRADLVNFCKDRISKLKSGSSKPTKNQIENESIKVQIVEMLASGPMSATEIAKALDITGQKATALLTLLKKAGAVVRVEEKGKATFTLPSDDEAVDVEDAEQ